MKPYLESIKMIKQHGVHKGDRTGTGTQSMFGQHERYDLSNNQLPVVTTKKIHLPSVIHELIWMLSGDTKVDYLIANGVRIWNEWVKPETAVYEELPLQQRFDLYRKAVGFKPGEGDPDVEHLRACFKTDEDIHKFFDSCNVDQEKLVGGDLGPVYGKTWRDIDDTRIVSGVELKKYTDRGFKIVSHIRDDKSVSDVVVTRKIDQIQEVIDLLEKSPDSRRIIVSAWDPRLVDDQALPPCHSFFQFWTRELSIQERIDWMDDRQQREDMETNTRGKPPYGNVEAFRNQMRVWHGDHVETDEWVHNRLDLADIPKRAISCQLYQR